MIHAIIKQNDTVMLSNENKFSHATCHPPVQTKSCCKSCERAERERE